VSGSTEEDGEHAEEEEARGLVLVHLVADGHDAHCGAGRLLVQQDALLKVKVAAVWPVVGQVQRADGQHGAHDVVAGQALLDDVPAPKVPYAGVRCEGGVRFGGEVVEELKFEEWQGSSFGERRGRAGPGSGGGRGRGRRLCLCLRDTGRGVDSLAAPEKGTFYTVGDAVETCWMSLITLGGVSGGNSAGRKAMEG
jgi:hypothetical protein